KRMEESDKLLAFPLLPESRPLLHPPREYSTIREKSSPTPHRTTRLTSAQPGQSPPATPPTDQTYPLPGASVPSTLATSLPLPQCQWAGSQKRSIAMTS